MQHPFEKLFNAALRKSTPEENLVRKEAEKLRQKGYAPEEIHGVLAHLLGTLLNDQDIELVRDAKEEMERHLDIP